MSIHKTPPTRALLKAVQPALCFSMFSVELSGEVFLLVGLLRTLFSCLSPAWREAASGWLWRSHGEYMAAHTLLARSVHAAELFREAERGRNSDHVVLLHLYFIHSTNPCISTTAQ